MQWGPAAVQREASWVSLHVHELCSSEMGLNVLALLILLGELTLLSIPVETISRVGFESEL